MLATAQERLAALPVTQQAKLKFLHGDVRSVRVDATFDAVVSLFHVVSYQTSNQDLAQMFATAKVHLKPGGIFLFDCWYGPAVLTDRPAVRIKRLQDEKIQVTRIAEPTLDPNQNQVEVNYQVFVCDLATNAVETINESHKMRYLFTPEIEALFTANGFNLIASGEWLTQKPPGFDTWGVYYVGQLMT
jgi:SAM-dependent methyltransferase